jgi:hypothetical protein
LDNSTSKAIKKFVDVTLAFDDVKRI